MGELMNVFFTRLACILVVLLQSVVVVCAGPLDDYYLQQFGESKSLQLQKAILSVLPVSQEPTSCGMPLKHSLKRDWNLLEQPTQKVLAKQLAAPTLSGTTSGSEPTLLSPSGRFNIHYTTTGADAVPSIAWVQTVAETFDSVASLYNTLGYQPAPSRAGAPYDVYLLDLAPKNYYGVTTSGWSAPSAGYPYAVTSWIEIDNNFTDSIFHPETYTPLQSLQITAAHEYHHAIQYGYSFYFGIWYAEATSTWLENELYPDVYQLYNYIHPWFAQSSLSLDISESLATGGGYGRWIFNRYLAEKYNNGSVDAIREVWEKLASLDPAANPVNSDGDIQMVPVIDSILSTSHNSTLGSDFFGFAKRVYVRDWSSHTGDISRIPTFSAPTVTPSVTLPHYSFVYYKFTPTASSTSLTINLSKTSGIQTAVFKKATSGTGGAISPVDANSGGASYTVGNFDTTEEVVLLIANTSPVDGHMASFSTDGSNLPVIEPGGGSVYVTPSGGKGGGSGCFIATAAYGSYLHPHVQQLRSFRDQYLLTNAPGQAFVALYYRYSPPLADSIARHAILRAVARLALTPLFVVIAYPLLSAAVLLMLSGVLLGSLRRRFKTVQGPATPYNISTISRF